jgi:subtilisin family serine protease
MRGSWRCCWLLLGLGFVLGFVQFSRAQIHPATYHGRKAAEGEVLVKFRQLATGTMASDARQADLSSMRPLGGVPRLYHLHSRSRKVAELLAQFSGRADVLYAEPNYQWRALALPDDPQFASQWALQNTGQYGAGFPAGTAGADISAVLAWDISTGSTAHVLGVVDTGIDYTHAELQANVWSAPTVFSVMLNGITVTCPAGSHGFNAITLTCDPMDDHMHGTHVSGILGAAGNNGFGVAGVNWTAQIMGLKFLNAQGYGYTSDAINAIEFGIQAKAVFAPTAAADVRILSNSWGGGAFSQALEDEIDRAGQNDMLFVAAAGNNAGNNDTNPVYPAGFNRPNMIVVAATDNNDQLAMFSNFGPTTVHLGAPGVGILSTVLGGGYGYLSGTSMATPFVSGTAALMLSACSLSMPDLKKNLLDNVDQIPSLAGLTVTGGRLNVNRAIRSCNGPVGLSPSSVSFGALAVGKSSTTRTVTLTNYQSSPLNLSNIVITGDFTESNNCGSALAPKASCTINVMFTPSVAGTRNGQLQVVDDAATSPQTAQLFGSGTQGPDLVASTSTLAKATSPGSIIGVNSTVVNQGTADAIAAAAGIYLSRTGWKDGSAIAVGEFNSPPLPINNSFSTTTSVTIPAGIMLGPYFVLTCADDTDQITELDESNNCGATAAAIQIQLADLIESSVSFARSSPQTIQITETVSNQGAADAPASVTQFYAGLYPTKDAGARPLGGSRAVPLLSPGNSSQGTTTVSIPTGLVGNYYVLACADDTNLVAENSKSNNCAAAATRLQAGPDLTEYAVSSATTVTGAGAALTVSDTASNQGPGNAVASFTQYYLSPFTSKSGSARLLMGNRPISALAANGASAGSATVTVPSDMSTGIFYLLACADDTALVPELNESNNCAAGSTRLQVGPDLIESAVSTPNTVTGPGGTVTINDSATNQGGGNASASLTQYYLSAFTTKVASSRLLAGSRPVPAVGAGAASAGSATATVPADVAAGTYYLLACADDTNVVAESNESNNCAAASVRVQVGSDLTESGVSSQTYVSGAGATITVSDTAVNQGGGAAAATFTQYYLSTFTTKTSTSRLLTGARAVPMMAAGGNSSGSVSVTLPADVATGAYYLLACADDTNLVIETNESNNCAAATRMQVGPDLTESGVSVSATLVAPGGTLTVMDTAMNKGGGSAGASSTQFYLAPFTTKSAGARLLAGNRAAGPLSSGVNSPGTTIITVPPDMGLGTFYLLACADDTNVVSETNENNNCAAAGQRVQVSQ